MALKEDRPIHSLKAGHTVLSHHALNATDKLPIDLAIGHSAFVYCQEEIIVQRNKIYTFFLYPCLSHSGHKKENVDAGKKNSRPAHKGQDFFTGENISLPLIAFPLIKKWLVRIDFLGCLSPKLTSEMR